MKRYLSFVLFAGIIWFVAFFAGCDNGTEPNNDNPSDSTDVLAPFVREWTPETGSVDVPRGVTLWVSISDTGEFATGLDPDSIGMTVDGSAVVPSLIDNSFGGLDLRYIPPSRFDWGDTVAVHVDAADLAGNWLHASSEFYIEIGDTFGLDIDTLPPLSGFVSRSRPGGFTTEGLYFATASASYVTLTGGSPYSVGFTPRRSWILYDPYSSGDIYAVNPSLGIEVQLTEDAAEEKYPALSSDGHTLGFARGEDVVLKNLQTNEESVLASSSQGGRELEFSHSGQYLAYRSGSGSYNPKLYIRKVADGDNVSPSTIYNDVSSFDWSHSSDGIACIVSGNRLYYWDAEVGGYPALLYSADELQFTAIDGSDNIYFVERTATGDKIRSSTLSGFLSPIIDLTSEAATVEALAVSEGGDLIFAKRSGSVFSLEYLPSGASTSTTLTTAVGQTIQLAWF